MAAPDDLVHDIFQPDGYLRADVVTEPALAALNESLRQAQATNWDNLRSPHIFMGLLAAPDPGVRYWGERLEEDLSHILGQFQELFQQDTPGDDHLLRLHREFFSDNALRLLRDAHERATSHHRAHITPMDLLISLLTTPNSIVAECFERIGITAAKLTELAVLAEHRAHPG